MSPDTGEVIKCTQVVLCTGTFLSGEIHIGRLVIRHYDAAVFMHVYARSLGMKRFPAGRMGDSPARGLSESLARAGFELGRLQTGTPARLDARTVNVKGMEVQEGNLDPSPFSFLNTTVANKVSRSMYVRVAGSTNPTQDNQVVCYKTHTTPETHSMIRESMHLSVHIQETKKG
jgi:tRNA uridine 5-carboxymethylaminomethyl modification enzyme